MAKAAVIKNAGTDRQETAKEAADKKASRPILRKQTKYTKISDVLAESDFYMRNYPVPGAPKLFVDWKMHYVDLYYPNAKVGESKVEPLYMDFPRSNEELERCKKKKNYMREQGLRYTYLEAGKGEAEAREILES